MDDNNTLTELEELVERLGMKIRYEPVYVSGSGYCRIKEQEFVIINNKATPREKIHILMDAVKQRDLTDVDILPSIMELLDKKYE
jgi:hypothetical protein